MSKSRIVSQLPGTFYRRPSPDSPPFVVDGDTVTAETVIGIIEVMKTFQEMKAEVAGSGIRFLVENGDAVMAGDDIAEVDS